MAFFYVLHSETLDKYYIGHTEMTIDERLRRHLSEHRGWTSKARDWHVVHLEPWPTKADAMKREREVKGWKKRSRIEEMIQTRSERPAS